jgi:hypothetical protein
MRRACLASAVRAASARNCEILKSWCVISIAEHRVTIAAVWESPHESGSQAVGMNRDFEKVLNAGNKLSAEQVYTSTQMYGQRNKHDMEVETDRAAALADKCQEDAR